VRPPRGGAGPIQESKQGLIYEQRIPPIFVPIFDGEDIASYPQTDRFLQRLGIVVGRRTREFSVAGVAQERTNLGPEQINANFRPLERSRSTFNVQRSGVTLGGLEVDLSIFAPFHVSLALTVIIMVHKSISWWPTLDREDC
jgi:hypothetical protein